MKRKRVLKGKIPQFYDKDGKVLEKSSSAHIIGVSMWCLCLLTGCGWQTEPEQPQNGQAESTVMEDGQGALHYEEGTEKAAGMPDAAESLTQTEPESGQENEAGTEPGAEEASAEQKLLEGMTLRQKLYQMILTTPEQITGETQVTEAGELMQEGLEAHPVGGIIFFAENLILPEQTEELLAGVQRTGTEIEKIPLFLAVDEEGGRVARIGQNAAFDVPRVGAMAELESAQEAYECGNTIGAYLSELGFNVDFAPDADVITNPDNTVIGDRSFGTDAKKVTEYAAAYSDGLHANHILSTFKHFPGHGATEGDTHEGYAYTSQSYEELLGEELLPFAAASAHEVDMVMAAHISVPEILGDDTPCSLSYEMLTDVLREDLGYEGLIITDALNMGAIAEQYSSGEAAVMAVSAGADILLMPENLEEAYEALYDAVQCRELTEERIDESVLRILRAKSQL